MPSYRCQQQTLLLLLQSHLSRQPEVVQNLRSYP